MSHFDCNNNCQFDEAPKGPKLSWDYTSEMSKCDTGNFYFCTKPSKFIAPDKQNKTIKNE